MEEVTLKIAIIGAGAIGKRLATILVQHHDVTMVVRREQQKQAIITHGMKLENGPTFTIPATTTLPSASVYIVTVKSYALPDILPMLQQITNDASILFLQNGLAHLPLLKQLPNTYAGTVTMGAQSINDFTVAARGSGLLRIAAPVQHKLMHLNSLALPVESVSDTTALLWQKAIINTVINPLTAIMRISNGELLTNASAYATMQAIYKELQQGIPQYCPLAPFNMIEQVCQQTAYNTSSMLSDFLAERKSEINEIVGEVLALGNAEKMPKLSVIYQLLRAIEERYI